MLITVEVLSYKGQSPVERLSVSFDQQGGTLGRSPENHFVLSDPQNLISRQHAVIRYENGCYYLQDTSTTGTFIYNKNLRVHQDRTPLDDGDKIRIGDYDLIVCIPEAVTSHAGETSFSCPEPEPGPCPSTSVSTNSTLTQKNRHQAYDELLKVFLEAAGIQDIRSFPQEDIPAIMRTAGALFREMIDALGTMLRGRAAAKSYLRTTVTTIQAVQNNPLKFAVADDILTLLLTTQHPGYLTGVEAVRAGCTDFIHHELAMTAGVQAAILALFARVAPQHFVPPDAAGNLLPRRTKSKAKCWEAYCQAYRQVVAEAEDFFGLEAFGRAYEEQLGKLRSQDHKSS